jgi:DtxR family Mn-dependent transcriptional regulator
VERVCPLNAENKARRMASLTVENYVKAIYQLAQNADAPAVATGQIAVALGVLPGTVTSMLKTLDESRLATYTPYEGVRLTAAGRALALRVLRRHRLIEQFLSQTLQLTWDEVHEEAENMEHAVSDRLVDRIDAYLGHPPTDPHGDPIPTADGTLPQVADRSLADCDVGQPFHLARVTDQSPAFLRSLSQAGLEIGAQGVLVSNEPASADVTIQLAGESKTLSREVAGKLMVR